MGLDDSPVKKSYSRTDSSKDYTAIMNNLPAKMAWEKFQATSAVAAQLDTLTLTTDRATESNKAAFLADPKSMIDACMTALDLKDVTALCYISSVIYNMLREDSSCYKIFEDEMKKGTDTATPMFELLKRPRLDQPVADRISWILSSIMAHQPRSFDMLKVSEFIQLVLKSDACSELGRLESFVNLLKCEKYRVPVWMTQPGVVIFIFNQMDPQSSTQMVYKSLFATWMLSFSPDIIQDMRGEFKVVERVKDILLRCRAEKVIRLSLTVLKNLISNKALAEDIVKEGLLDVVQQLEYEKWRDTELYDDIHSVAAAISAEVKDLSSFERYQEELESGSLTWSYLHTSKFWAENVMKLDVEGYPAIHMLGACLDSSDPLTLAVACHDIGEFVALHPNGKKIVAGIPSIKEKVMFHMASDRDDRLADYREVRRQALLCCQKMMLSKWQDVAVEKK